MHLFKSILVLSDVQSLMGSEWIRWMARVGRHENPNIRKLREPVLKSFYWVYVFKLTDYSEFSGP